MLAMRTVTVVDSDTDTRWPGVAADCLRAGIHSSLSLPLRRASRSIGGLNMYGAAPGAFSAQSQRPLRRSPGRRC